MPNKTHGQANNRLTGYTNRAYGIWQRMKDRCGNPNSTDYAYYGKKGIAVCAEWRASFSSFLEDMGHPAPAMTLERIDRTKGYCKSNCKWATRAEQSLNTSQTKLITINNETKPLVVWLKEKKLSKGTYYDRVHRGWAIEEAITKPSRR